MEMTGVMKEVLERLQTTWPDARLDEVVWIAPIGSRGDVLIYWRTQRRVTTGRRGTAPCFEGSLEDFKNKVEADYGRRLLPAPFLDYQVHQETLRHRADYRAAISFFETLETNITRRNGDAWDGPPT